MADTTDDLIAKMVSKKRAADAEAARKHAEITATMENQAAMRAAAESEWAKVEQLLLNEIATVNEKLVAADWKLILGKLDKTPPVGDVGGYMLHATGAEGLRPSQFNATFHPNVKGNTKVWLNEREFEHARGSFEFQTRLITTSDIDKVIKALLQLIAEHEV